MTQKTVLSDGDLKLLIDSYIRGSSLKTLAKEFNCSKPTIKRLLVENNVSIRKSGRPKGRTYVRPRYYYTWNNIKTRCNNPLCKDYIFYGARGISMHSNWIDSYQEFEDYILATIGDRPKGYSLDRVNNDGNYEPGNLKWSTPKEQANNRRR